MIGGNDPTRVGTPSNLPADAQDSMRPPEDMADISLLHRQLQSTVVPPPQTPGALPVAWRRDRPFVLGDLVGEGGFAQVFRATQTSLNRTVAVKRPRASGAPVPDRDASHVLFGREALVSAQLDHPNIVPVYDLAFDPDGTPLLAMKLVEGQSWLDQLDRDRVLPPEELLARHLPTLLTVARAVASAHARGIIHRDLKPAQVVVGQFGEVYLMDWGLAAALPGATSQTGVRMDEIAIPVADAPNPAGTPAFMAPEQTVKSPAGLGTWTDVYLLGGILYFLVTGSPPHQQATPLASFQHAAAGTVTMPAGIAPELEAILARSLEPAPARRMQTAAEFVRAIEDFQSGRDRHQRADSLLRAAADLERAGGDGYERFEEADRLVAEAIELAPDQPGARELQTHIVAGFVRAAIARDDLRLAAAQVMRIADDSLRSSLEALIAAGEARFRRNRLQRRAAIAGMFVTAVLASGIGLMTVRQVARARAAEVEIRTETSRNEVRILAATENKKRETAARDLHETLAAMRASTQELLLHPFLRLATVNDLRPTHSTGETLLRGRPDMGRELAALAGKIRRQRAVLETSGTALEPVPAGLLVAEGLLALTADTTASRAEAFRAYSQAIAAQPRNQEAWIGMAVAAGRNGETSTAVSAIRRAVRLGMTTSSGQDSVARGVAGQIYEQAGSAIPPRPDDLLIESWPRGGRNADHYREVSGSWAPSVTASRYKSAAPGCTSHLAASTRDFVFSQPYFPVETTSPAVARFHPRFSAPRLCHPHITWPPQANASPVHIRVRHAGGDTTFAVTMDGFGYLGEPSSDKWVDLGEFRFLPGEDQFVEVAAGEDAVPVGLNQFGTVCADAVLFTSGPFRDPAFRIPVADVSTTAGPSAVAGGFHTGGTTVTLNANPTAALAEARGTGKPLCLLFWYPVPSNVISPLSQSSEYCLRRLFLHPLVTAELKRHFVTASVNIGTHPELSARYEADRGVTTIVIAAPDGKPLDRLTVGTLPPSPVELAERLRRAGAKTGK